MEVVLPKPGKYVVAVSGGVDSVALLHYLQAQPGLELIVAHFDHGIRADSQRDRVFVEELAQNYDLSFIYDEGRLGSKTSEAAARQARYKFLNKTRQVSNAQAIITAHHQDDVLETAIINMLRGTGRKGLTSLSSQPSLLRPLINSPKQKILNYAEDQGLKWREDSTNQDETYMRNYVRKRLLPKFDEAARQQLLDQIKGLSETNHVLDDLLSSQLLKQSKAGELDRQWFNALPHDVAREVLAAWLRANNQADFDSKTLERLVVAGKTAAIGRTFPVRKNLIMLVQPKHLALARPER